MTDVRESIDAYLTRLDAALRDLHERERVELVAEVRAHLEEAAARAGDPERGVEAAVRSLGDPRVLAERLREGEVETPAPERVKRILGMPYNFRRLSSEEVARRIWNPSDPRIFMPRIFGIGWTINFGSVAVRLGLVRPDDEEPVPFASVPARPLAVGLAVLTAVDLAALAAALLLRDPPRLVPVHWGFTAPDGFAAPLTAALWFLGPVLALNLAALWRFGRGASSTSRVLWLCMLTLAATILLGFYANALAWAFTGSTPVNPGVPVLAGLVGAFVVLVVYSRLGIRTEWRRADLK